MKVAFFTPSHSRSAIARVTVMVRTALELAGHSVSVIATENVEPASLDVNPALADATKWRDDAAVRKIVAEADMVFHQIGDNSDFHLGSVAWLAEIGGSVVLHDIFLGDLFLAWLPSHWTQAEDLLERWYGLPIEKYLEASRSGRFIDLTWPSYPLTEWICSQADGVVLHSDFALPIVERATNVPTIVVPLPYDLVGGKSIIPSGQHQLRDASDRTLRLLTVGIVNPNKLCDVVINAIAANRATRHHVEYRIVGSVRASVRSALMSLADDLGVRLTIVGEVDDQQLLAELETADIIACLRLPALESASASAIEGMLSGTPLIVIDTGFYASLPRDCVFHVSKLDPQSGLSAVLVNALIGQYDLPQIGRAAKEYAEATFRADNYASALVGLGLTVAKHRPEREIDTVYASLYASWGAVVGSLPVSEYAEDTQIFRS